MRIYIQKPYCKTKYVIIVNNKELYENLNAYYSNMLINDAEDALKIEVKCDENGFEIITNSASISSHDPISDINRYIFNTTEAKDGYFILHGALFQYHNDFVVFLAPSGTGKSTMMAYLLQKGAKVISDDYIVIDKNTFEIIPVTLPILLREGGLEVLKRKGISFSPKQINYSNFKRWSITPPCCKPSRINLKHMYFILRTSKNHITTDSRKDIVEMLFKSSLCRYDINTENLSFILKLSKHYRATLNYNDLDFVVSILNDRL